MIDLIREIIDAKGHLPVAARTVDPNANLYEAGLSPFAAIQVMLALEAACGVEFPKQTLCQRSFSSLNSIAACSRRVERKAAQASRGSHVRFQETSLNTHGLFAPRSDFVGNGLTTPTG